MLFQNLMAKLHVNCCYYQKTGVKEQELTELAKENKESKIRVFGVVDLDYQFTFALKVTAITCKVHMPAGYTYQPAAVHAYCDRL